VIEKKKPRNARILETFHFNYLTQGESRTQCTLIIHIFNSDGTILFSSTLTFVIDLLLHVFQGLVILPILTFQVVFIHYNNLQRMLIIDIFYTSYSLYLIIWKHL